MKKTFKREISTAMVLFLGGFYIWGAQGNLDAMAAAESLKVPILLWAGAAFGADWYGKQMPQ